MNKRTHAQARTYKQQPLRNNLDEEEEGDRRWRMEYSLVCALPLRAVFVRPGGCEGVEEGGSCQGQCQGLYHNTATLTMGGINLPYRRMAGAAVEVANPCAVCVGVAADVGEFEGMKLNQCNSFLRWQELSG